MSIGYNLNRVRPRSLLTKDHPEPRRLTHTVFCFVKPKMDNQEGFQYLSPVATTFVDLPTSRIAREQTPGCTLGCAR